MPPRKASKPVKRTVRKPASRKDPRKDPRKDSRAEAAATIYRTCSRCGRMEECPEGGLPPGWSMGMEGKRVEYLDPGCARANIRAIEGRLTEEYWEF